MVLAFCALTISASAIILLEESFDYDDGALEVVSGDLWSIRSGNPLLSIESDALSYRWSVLNLEGSYTGYYTRILSSTVSVGRVIADFRIRFDELETALQGDQWVFLQFTNEAGGARRGRLYARLESGGENMQLGISSLSSNAVKWSDRSFAPGETHHLALAYDVETGETFLWVDPGAGGPPLLVDQDDNKHPIGRLSVEIDTRKRLGKYRIFDVTVRTGAGEPPETVEPVEVFLAESFPYQDGPLLADASYWRIRTGSADHTVSANRLLLTPDGFQEDGYITRNLTRRVEKGPIYLAFDLSLPGTPVVHEPVDIIFLTDASGALGRAFIVLEGTAEGWRIGLRGTAGGITVWSSLELISRSTDRWLLAFDPETGLSQLWKGSGEGAALLEVAGNAQPIRRIAIGSDARMPAPAISLGFLHASSTAEHALSMPRDVVTLPHADKVHLFLLIGQSNMAGRGALEEKDKLFDQRILVFNEDREWQIAQEPLHWDRPGFNGVGPAMSFARTLLPTLPKDAVIGLIPAAAGGTSIAWWTKDYSGANTYYGGQYLYPHALSRTKDALRQGTLAGILWNQGESDGGAAENDGGSSYRTRLHQLIADFRADLKAPEAPFIVSTLGPWRNTPALNAVFLSLPDEVPFTAAVNTLDPAVSGDLVNNPFDPPHYRTPSYRLLGQLYGEQFLPFWKPDSAFVRSPGGLVEAGSSGFVIGFDANGGMERWETNGYSLIPDGASAVWDLSNEPTPETYTYSENPPLSWKWRSPRTMASWTVGEDEMGVVLANNHTGPALFSVPLDGDYLTHLRAMDGSWEGLTNLPLSIEVDRLRWEFPDGRIGLWRGEGLLEQPDGAGDFVLHVPVEAGGVGDWSWQVGQVALLSPQRHAVYQRATRAFGNVLIEGMGPTGSVIATLAISGGTAPFSDLPPNPIEIPVDPVTGAFSQKVELPAGGWYQLDLTAFNVAGEVTATIALEPFGVGEVFVVAGQSNSTNSGQTRTRQESGMVSAFSGSGWRPANDPLPGSHDNAARGSFQPSLGDALADHFRVPVGFASTGQGASGIRHWQPDYEPDFENNTFFNGLYPWTLYRIKQLGSEGFRALLWHQGESDASRGVSLDGEKVERYSNALIRVLSHWRADAQWSFPALTAQVSLWPVENAQYGGDPFLREAQKRVWELGFALPGPDTDQLGLEYRQDDTPSRVHFNEAGLKAHGELWSEMLLDFIGRELLRKERVQLHLRREVAEWVLNFQSPAGAEFVAETSDNLTDWIFWQLIPSGESLETIELRDSTAENESARFYRLRGIDFR